MREKLVVQSQADTLFVMQGGPARAIFTVRNEDDHPVTVEPKLSVPTGFDATADPPSFRLEPAESLDVAVDIVAVDRRMPRGTVTLHAGDAFAWVSLFASDNWVRVATITASSSVGAWTPEAVKDGWAYDDFRWKAGFGWQDGTNGAFPDWVMASWPEPIELSSGRVVTVDTEATPAATHGVRDLDVQVQLDGEDRWTDVAQVRGNLVAEMIFDFPAVTATALRIIVLASNDGVRSRLVEIEAFGPGGRPRSVWVEVYGGPGAPFPP